MIAQVAKIQRVACKSVANRFKRAYGRTDLPGFAVSYQFLELSSRMPFKELCYLVVW